MIKEVTRDADDNIRTVVTDRCSYDVIKSVKYNHKWLGAVAVYVSGSEVRVGGYDNQNQVIEGILNYESQQGA